MAMYLPQWMLNLWNLHYAKAIIVMVGAYVVMQALLFLSEKVFLAIAKRTQTQVDDLVVEKTRRPLALLVFFLGMRFAAEFLEFSEQVNLYVKEGINSVMILFIAFVVMRLLNIGMDSFGHKLASRTKNAVDDGLLHIGHRFVGILIFFLAGIGILKVWGVQVGPLLASLGIAGIAVAFALQTTLGNIFGGVAILVDKSIRIGDTIQLDDGTVGKVLKISLRSTKICSVNNELIIIPNGKFADSKIMNWSLPDRRLRVVVTFGVEYGSDVEKVKKVATDLLKADKGVLVEPAPEVFFLKMSDFALDFSARFWIADLDDKVVMKDKVTTAIYAALRKNKIGIPFPTRTIYLKKDLSS
ncbi:MAG: mechanosensitive ion channel family protein [Nanoarchaeota archaeon]|nr:mechanosensitive ion channel family protein [Nanoarchaeota archaeon]